MTKTAKRSPMKKVSKKLAVKKAGKTAPKMNVMMKVLKEKEEQRKLHDKGHSDSVIHMHANGRSGWVKNQGFSRFAGPRRKAA